MSNTVIPFSNIDYSDVSPIVLKTANGTTLGTLGYAHNIQLEAKYNETSALSFDLPLIVNGDTTPHYYDVVGMRHILLPEIGEFVIVNPNESGDGVHKYKHVQCYSIEYEFSYKSIVLAEDTYQFYSTNDSNSILRIIMDLMPSWSLGTIDDVVKTKWRTFSVDGENLYNFIKNTVQQTYECIFEFDTLSKTVNVRDVNSVVTQQPVFMSQQNLLKEVEVSEDTESIVTRLAVYGADDISIHDVNPIGGDYLINLDYFMTTDHFSQELIDKYNTWQALVDTNRTQFYLLTVQYANSSSTLVRLNAELNDLVKTDLGTLEEQRAVIISAILENISGYSQTDLDNINAQIATKNAEIAAKEAEIATEESNKASILSSMQSFVDTYAFENYFTTAELKEMDYFIRDGEVSDDTFTTEANTEYIPTTETLSKASVTVTLDGTDSSSTSGGYAIYRGANVQIGYTGLTKYITGRLQTMVFQTSTGHAMLLVNGAKVYTSPTDYDEYNVLSIDIAGTVSDRTTIDTSESFVYSNGKITHTTDETTMRSSNVAWDLLEYGRNTLAKLSQPTYSFNVTSANFLALDEFLAFKNRLTLGDRVYIQLDETRILTPLCIGVQIVLDDPSSMTMEFGNTFNTMESSFQLVDLLEQSISVGQKVDSSKYTYASFENSGASNSIRDRMTTALDVALQNIYSSSQQAISWDTSGLHLRKWTSDAQTSYDDEQIWANNNSILMTTDGWATAKMAIGKFYDSGLGGTVYGICAPMIMGTMIAGQNLHIQSGDGSLVMDENGCAITNATLSITRGYSKILLDPTNGIKIQKYNNNAWSDVFYADSSGNLIMTGQITANSGYIGGTTGWAITSGALTSVNGKVGMQSNSTANGIAFYAGNATPGSAPFRVDNEGDLTATSATITGTITANSGYIGGTSGWAITTGILKSVNGKVGMQSNSNANGIAFYAGNATPGNAPFRVDNEGDLIATSATITGAISGSTITGGSINIGNGNFVVNSSGALTATNATITGGSITITSGGTTTFSLSTSGRATFTAASSGVDPIVIATAQNGLGGLQFKTAAGNDLVCLYVINESKFGIYFDGEADDSVTIRKTADDGTRVYINDGYLGLGDTMLFVNSNGNLRWRDKNGTYHTIATAS